MMYVIDTKRVQAWRAAFPEEAVLVGQDRIGAVLRAEDVVFAHTPTDLELVANQHVKTNTEGLRRIAAFRSLLSDTPPERRPILLLYSGEPETDEETAGILVPKVCRALGGYSADRIRVISAQVDRAIGPEALRRLMLCARAEAEGAGVSRLVTIPRGVETNGLVHALAFLCEAHALVTEAAGAARRERRFRAPASPEEWLAPFASGSVSQSADAVIEALPAAFRDAARVLFTAGGDERAVRSAVARVLELTRENDAARLIDPIVSSPSAGGARYRRVAVLGDGAKSEALRFVFGCVHIPRAWGDRGWAWPRRGPDSSVILLVMNEKCSVAQVIAGHADAWACPYARELSCAVIGVSSEQILALRRRDVFGRGGQTGETFEDWSSYVALVADPPRLSEIAALIEHLNPCPVTTWKRCAAEAAFLPELVAAISARDVTALRVAAEKTASHDWDAACCRVRSIVDEHRHAFAISQWLSAVASGEPFSWDKGGELLGPLVGASPA